MSTAIRAQIVKIGNSRGVRIPKILLEQSGLPTEVEIEVQGNQLMIRAASQVRAGWGESFAAMAKHQDDGLIDDISLTDWEQSEWDW